ncbi:MAG: 4a-hydroxytetrahydrobiopterin dehydratase [Gemmatimonadales bacterium]
MAIPDIHTAETIAGPLAELPGWAFGDNLIYREFQTDGWPTTLMVVNAIGFVCEAADHHPDLMVTWGKVVVSLSSHRAGGVTDFDLAMARHIDEVVLWRPGADSPLQGTSRPFVQGG